MFFINNWSYNAGGTMLADFANTVHWFPGNKILEDEQKKRVYYTALKDVRQLMADAFAGKNRGCIFHFQVCCRPYIHDV